VQAEQLRLDHLDQAGLVLPGGPVLRVTPDKGDRFGLAQLAEIATLNLVYVAILIIATS
jgi:hypothetical protein